MSFPLLHYQHPDTVERLPCLDPITVWSSCPVFSIIISLLKVLKRLKIEEICCMSSLLGSLKKEDSELNIEST